MTTKKHVVKITFLFVIVLIVTGCFPHEAPLQTIQSKPWQYADLRILDDIDSLDYLSDIIAVYTRLLPETVEFRVDFLEYSLESEPEITFLIDMFAGGADQIPSGISDISWDLAVYKNSTGDFQAYDRLNKPVHNLKLQVLTDPIQDYIVIRLKNLWGNAVLYQSKVQVITSSHNQLVILDRTEPVIFSSAAPQRVQLLLAFWNTFEAYTQSQALRRWDGAHTGPDSSRHGLHNLLIAVEKTKVPVFLLDLKSPSNLSALDMLDALGIIDQLVSNELIIVPDVSNITGNPVGSFPELPALPSWVYEQSLEASFQAAVGYGLSPFDLAYVSDILAIQFVDRQVVFVCGCVNSEEKGCEIDLWVRFNGYAQIYKYQISKSLSKSGPALDFRRRLIQSTFRQPNQLVVEGGDFALSAWGDPQAALAALTYISEHPWIHPLNQSAFQSLLLTQGLKESNTEDLDSLSDLFQYSNPKNPDESQLAEITSALYSTSQSSLFNLPWDFYQSILSPTSTDRYQLRRNYDRYLYLLLSATDWAEHPRAISDCEQDFDNDGTPECILASEQFFNLIKLKGGYILFSLASTPSGIYQIIAPSYQFFIGISDPSVWKVNQGIASDPEMIPGAFADDRFLDEFFTPEINSSKLTLTNPDRTVLKTIELKPDTIEIILAHPQPQEWPLPLILLPGFGIQNNWSQGFQVNVSSNQVSVDYANLISMIVSTDQQLEVATFLDSFPYLNSPEDPNFDYPSGHYIPFPFFLAHITSPGSAVITIQINSP